MVLSGSLVHLLTRSTSSHRLMLVLYLNPELYRAEIGNSDDEGDWDLCFEGDYGIAPKHFGFHLDSQSDNVITKTFRRTDHDNTANHLDGHVLPDGSAVTLRDVQNCKMGDVEFDMIVREDRCTIH